MIEFLNKLTTADPLTQFWFYFSLLTAFLSIMLVCYHYGKLRAFNEVLETIGRHQRGNP